MVERACLYIGIVDDVAFIIPIRKAVPERRRKSQERYTRNDAAMEKYAAKVFSC
jgi:hypothetical protein